MSPHLLLLKSSMVEPELFISCSYSSFFCRYLDNVEVFCPNDACSKAPFAPLPFGLVGMASAFSKGVAFVCCGARGKYTACITKNGANYCKRNAECVSTAGNSLWCTGPKISTCHIYDRYLSKSWIRSQSSLITARAFSASVVLPDGRVWILGGAGSSSVLQSTEILEVADKDIGRVRAGPDLPEALMGPCASVLSISKVIIIGGYSTLINDYSPTAFVYDFDGQMWNSDTGMITGSRIDSSCLSITIGSAHSVLMAGGWSNLALSDTAVYSAGSNKWLFFNGTSSSPLPVPLRSSGLVSRNQNPILLGGVTCNAESHSCTQTESSKYLF